MSTSVDTAPDGPAVGGLAHALGSVSSAMDALASVPVESLADADLTALVRSVAACEARLAALKARAVAAADRNGTSERSGASTPVGWLSDVGGGSRRSAHQTSRLAQAMDVVPGLGSAMRDGRIGSEQAQVVSTAVDRGVLGDADRARLVADAAVLSPEELRRRVRQREAVADQERLRRDEAEAKRERFHRMRSEPDGSVSGEYRLDAVAGQQLREAIGALTAPDPADTPLELRRTPDQRRADALSLLAKLTLEAGEVGHVRAVKPHVTVVTPVSMLSPDQAEAEADGAIGVTPDGTVLSAATTRKLLCDAAVRRLVVDPAGQPLDVGRATRTWSGAQRAALAAVDGGCRGPRCDRPFAWTDIHHVTWWRDGGETSLDNGLPVCGSCHDLVHDRRWTLTLDPASRRATWTSPDGEVIETRPRGPATELAARPLTPNHGAGRSGARTGRSGDPPDPGGGPPHRGGPPEAGGHQREPTNDPPDAGEHPSEADGPPNEPTYLAPEPDAARPGASRTTGASVMNGDADRGTWQLFDPSQPTEPTLGARAPERAQGLGHPSAGCAASVPDHASPGTAPPHTASEARGPYTAGVRVRDASQPCPCERGRRVGGSVGDSRPLRGRRDCAAAAAPRPSSTSGLVRDSRRRQRPRRRRRP